MEYAWYDLPRTNNALESWHKYFAIDMHSHPTCYISCYHKSCQIYLQLESGDIKIRKKSELDKDAKIQQHIKDKIDKISIIVHIELNLWLLYYTFYYNILNKLLFICNQINFY